jgi:gas vesicle protein
MVSSGQDYFGFLQYVAENATKLDSVGFTSRLQGYVGEIQAQDILSEQGFTAVLASTSNNPGYDLSVDGLFNGYEFIDVKVAGDMAMVERSALERPDIAHFVNGDVAGKSDLPNVFVNQDLSREDIQETLQTSLGAAESLTSGDITGSLGDPVALAVMMGLVVLTQVRAVRNVEKSAEAAVVDGTWIIAGRAPGLLIGMGLGAWAGGKAGLLVDAGSAGFTAGAGATAGGVIGGLVGAIAGTELGDRTAKRIRNRPILHNGRRLDEALQRYGNVCRESGGMVELDTLIRRPLDRATQISDSLTEKGNKIKRTWRWRLWPDANQVLIVESARVSVIETGKCREIYESVRTDLDRIRIASDSDTAIGLLMANNPVLRVLTKCDLPELQDVRLFYVRQLRLLKQRKQPISSSRLVRKARGQITDK